MGVKFMLKINKSPSKFDRNFSDAKTTMGSMISSFKELREKNKKKRRQRRRGMSSRLAKGAIKGALKGLVKELKNE